MNVQKESSSLRISLPTVSWKTLYVNTGFFSLLQVASWEKEIYTCCRDGIVRRYQLSDL